MTKDEIREKLGLPALETKTSSSSQDVTDALNSLSPLVANKVLESMTPNEIRALIGLTPEQEGQSIPGTEAPALAAMKAKFSEDEVLNVFAEFGVSKQDFTILQSRHVFGDMPSDLEEAMNFEFAAIELTKLEANILDLIQKDKRVTPEVLASTTKTDVSIVNKILSGLATKGFIKTKTVGTTIERVLPKPLSELPAPEPDTKTYMMRYSYEWRNEIPVTQRNTSAHPSRPFCARLMQLDRLYSRAEIETISGRLGYSVFDRRGGWWTEPNGEHSPSCRHIWQSQIVVKKG